MAGLNKHPDFSLRMQQACDGNPKVPLPNYGRLGWFVKQFEDRFHESVTQETVRKWFAGEARPRQKTIGMLAAVLEVDDAWLTVGRGMQTISKEKKVLSAAASGVVNLVAGMIQISGGTPAFPPSDGPVDLNAVIRGALYSFHIVLGVTKGNQVSFGVRLDAQETLVLGVVYTGDLRFEIFELDWETIEAKGDRTGGQWLIVEDVATMGERWRKITSFADRL